MVCIPELPANLSFRLLPVVPRALMHAAIYGTCSYIWNMQLYMAAT